MACLAIAGVLYSGVAAVITLMVRTTSLPPILPLATWARLRGR
jgi:hypothetical protein